MNEPEVAALLAELAVLRAENAALRSELLRVQQDLLAAQQQVLLLTQRLAQQHSDPPPFIKPAAAKREHQPRRKRDPKHNGARKRDPKPTNYQSHAADQCPTCGYQLRGHAVARRHQVTDLPPVAPSVVTEHQIIKRWCPHCEHWILPKQPLAGITLSPKGRMGVRLAAVVAYLRCILRLPVAQIGRYLHTMHQLRLSSGAIVGLVAQTYQLLQPHVAALRTKARASPVLHGDETGWRENGQNGYVWVFCTPDEAGPDAVRYYEYDPSRAGEVVKRLLHGFKGTLHSDFYGGYNVYAGKHQRCWVHLLRDLHALKEKHATDKAVLAWAAEVSKLYERAQELVRRVAPATQAEREALYVELVGRVHELGLQYSETKLYREHACHALCKRLLRHEGELFQFVLSAGLSDNNNQAERSIRPLVVVRKISGGSRSAAGTQARLGLFSLLETWRVRGLNPFDELLRLLQNPA